jgi:hypothetical protein
MREVRLEYKPLYWLIMKINFEISFIQDTTFLSNAHAN